MTKRIQLVYAVLIVLVGGILTAWNNDSHAAGRTLLPPTPTLTFAMKQLQFSWPAVRGAHHYRILENPDGVSGFTVIPTASRIRSTNHNLEIPVHLTNWSSAQYIVEACDSKDRRCSGSPSQSLSIINSIAATGYIKASNTGANDHFYTVALSGDGTTLAVGASYESSSATGINSISPGQLDNSADKAGAVYLFVKSGNTWVQQAYIKASNTGANDQFGTSLALSDNGNTLAVVASDEDSLSSGINSVPDDNAANAGAVYLFTRSGTSWTQEAYIKASNADSGDHFGTSVKLSNDGNTLAVGAYGEDSDATGIDGSQADAIVDTGAVYIYVRSGVTWTQQVYIKASNTGRLDNFGFSLALNGDGNTLVVGAIGEASADAGIDADQTDNTASKAGAVYVFVRLGESWAQQAYIKASNPDGGNVFSASEGDYFGFSVALNHSGDTLAVGAFEEGSSATGIDGDQLDNSAPKTGAAYVFTRSGTTWAQQAYIKASHTDTYYNWFGRSVAISSDGNTLSVGAYAESNSAKGVGGNEYEGVSAQAGAVYVYQRSSATWTQKSYVKAPNTDAYDWFGANVSMSNDGNTMAVGAAFEDSSSTGINGDQQNAAAGNSGAVYLY